MRYTLRLTASERDLLADLIGQRLDSVHTEGWSALLRFGDIKLHAVPEEVPTPDAAHPCGDVNRPMVLLGDDRDLMRRGQRVVENAGVVRAINILRVLVGFSPAVDYPAEEILPGVIVPASEGYGWIYHAPTLLAGAETESRPDGALVELDTAFELVTELYPSIVFYTSAHFLCVSTDGFPEDEDWVKSGYFVRQSLRCDTPA